MILAWASPFKYYPHLLLTGSTLSPDLCMHMLHRPVENVFLMRQEPGKNWAIVGAMKLIDRLSIRSRFYLWE